MGATALVSRFSGSPGGNTPIVTNSQVPVTSIDTRPVGAFIIVYSRLSP
ncbi:MAG TPA: hypothetical protein VGR73_17370 [Bryobacteraceae bacterium]|nr:hypothetical protein [Bryobacteraceae bacterium]